MTQFQLGSKLETLTDALVGSYRQDALAHLARFDQGRTPSQQTANLMCEQLIELAFPGYHGRQDLSTHNVRYHVGESLSVLARQMYGEINAAFCHERDQGRDPSLVRTGDGPCPCMTRATQATHAFFQAMPKVRELIGTDVHAAFAGDPAARSTDEIILCYPGLYCIAIHRHAHVLYQLGVPLIPRMMSEHAHVMTGIDIHPGARIGPSFFIDHGTGVVIGETTEIGERVRIYQGVTLGGLRPQKGQAIKGTKRHPTIEDDVVIGANAIILGGETVIGRGSTIGGSVFLTRSVAANTWVTIKPPELSVKTRLPEPEPAGASNGHGATADIARLPRPTLTSTEAVPGGAIDLGDHYGLDWQI